MNEKLRFHSGSAGRRAQAGVTLTELMLVLGVAGVMLSAAFGAYKVVSADNARQQFATDALSMINTVNNKWSMSGDYASATNANIIALSLVPSTFSVSGAVINSPYNTSITFTGIDAVSDGGVETATAAADQVLKTEFDNVPKDACPDLVKSLASLAFHVKVKGNGGAGTESQVKTSTSGLNFSQVIDRCTEGSSADVTAYVM